MLNDQIKYRPEIDGLRAVAVLAVVFYHAFPEYLPGGFIGVDVFFVISGYLITSILTSQLATQSFSLLDFYSRRIRRIFPSLILVLCAVLAFGWISLFQEEYRLLGKHVAAGATFLSNIVFWLETGYFDTAADTKPLLHLWSLAIEEQFYIAWPLALWAIWKLPRWRFRITVVLMLISFGVNAVMINKTPSAVFYLPFTRAWELLLGAMLAFLQSRESTISATQTNPALPKKKGRVLYEHLSLIGLILLAIGFAVINKTRHFPGTWALLPCLGAFAIIKAPRHSWVNSHILSNRLFVYVGLISYPLYLWHWPLLSYLRIMTSGAPTPTARAAAIVLSFVLAWLCYWALERWLRRPLLAGLKTFSLIAMIACVGGAGFFVFKQGGIPDREVILINPDKGSGYMGGSDAFTINDCRLSKSAQEKFANCKRDSRGTERYALIGDSKAAAIFDGLVKTSSPQGRWLFMGGTGPSYGPPVPVLSDEKVYETYQTLTRSALDAAANNPNVEIVALVFAARSALLLSNTYSIEDLPSSPHFEKAEQGITASVNYLLAAGKRVVLVIDNPTLPEPNDCIARKTSSQFVNKYIVTENPECRLSLSKQLMLSEPYRAMLDRVRNKTSATKVTIFDPTSILCETENGLCLPYKNGHLLYSYADHISDYASGLVGAELNLVLEQLVKAKH